MDHPGLFVDHELVAFLKGPLQSHDLGPEVLDPVIGKSQVTQPCNVFMACEFLLLNGAKLNVADKNQG